MTLQRSKPGPIVGILPGSRTQELDRNLSTLVRAAARIHSARPDARFLAACFKPAHREQVDAYLRKHPVPIETHVGRTPEIIRLSQACLAVSGSVGLELLYHLKPTVVLYRIGRFDLKVCNYFKTSRFISLVNLIADRELFPEFLTDRCEAEPMSQHVLRWLNDDRACADKRLELKMLRDQVAERGACEKAARAVLAAIGGGISESISAIQTRAG